MSEYIYLQGSEDVQRAGISIRNAADDMQRAASSISDSFENHRRYMDEWIGRLESAMASHDATPINGSDAEREAQSWGKK